MSMMLVVMINTIKLSLLAEVKFSIIVWNLIVLLVFQMILFISIFDTNITMLYINIKLKVFQGHSQRGTQGLPPVIKG